jgi:DNA mismatch endonuclease (patch repair protein)
MDIVDVARRSLMMSRVKSRDTAPEMAVRGAAHRIGLRFRLHRRDLPGRPDLIFPRYRLAVFVHGCYWHRHPNCKKASSPSTNVAFWEAKLKDNVARDKAALNELVRLGWQTLVIWECETKEPQKLNIRLSTYFDRLRAHSLEG